MREVVKKKTEATAATEPLFGDDELERARRYHRPLYVARLADLALGLALLAMLAFGSPGDALYASVETLPWWLRALVFAALVATLSFLVRLPVSFWRGYLREKRWGFSTQSMGGWLSDRAKSLVVGVSLTTVSLFGLFALARAFPGAWPLVAAAGAAALVLFLSFLAPVVFEPLFNRYVPLRDRVLADELRELAERAGVPVRDVLVADASRRTTKQNAYVSGLGHTRRVVLWDTLLARSDPHEVRLVVAHELAHRRYRHVALGTLLGMAAVAFFVLALWLLLRDSRVLATAGAGDAADPRLAPLVLLVGEILELVALPFAAALSRRFERAADRFFLDLTGDADAFVSVHRSLARANLADLDPPRALYLLFFTHPTPPERIASARVWEARS